MHRASRASRGISLTGDCACAKPQVSARTAQASRPRKARWNCNLVSPVPTKPEAVYRVGPPILASRRRYVLSRGFVIKRRDNSRLLHSRESGRQHSVKSVAVRHQISDADGIFRGCARRREEFSDVRGMNALAREHGGVGIESPRRPRTNPEATRCVSRARRLRASRQR